MGAFAAITASTVAIAITRNRSIFRYIAPFRPSSVRGFSGA
ncbi:hypothetical protein ACVIHI_008847 [Bradyrhizobium sp. USDA 4524]|nr:hypothetical protein [Bradyrhizobium sp. USDA 4538]MCP1906992.1 hypothetical protein [Bradyrhizobium sp. USDA 4537]MCP1985468.1 hypothetical protein [Bradyrhizobium sp. USDA 4539]